MKHLWININTSLDRKKFMEEQFDKHNLENIRIDAIIPNDFDNCLVQKRPLTCKHPGCTDCEYEYACLCSHIKAIRECLKYDDEFFVIMEDDIYLPYKIDYTNFIKNYPDNTDIMQILILYANTVITLFNHYKKTNNKYISWRYLLPSTGMYIISRKGAEKLVNQFYNEKEDKYDFTTSKYQNVADVLLYSSVNTYASTIPYCYPNIEMGSDIHPGHLNAHQDAINGIKFIIDNYNNDIPYLLK